MTTDMKAKIAAMQTKREPKPEIIQNDNGTWSHNRDYQCQWADRNACATDLMFHKAWERADAA